MTLNQLIKKATAFSRKYTTGDIPLMIYGTEVDITLTEHDDNGHLCIEMNYAPTPKEKQAEPSEQLSPEMKALLSQKVEDLDLSVRTRNILKRNGIDTILDICRLKRTDCLKFRDAGKNTLTELDDFLTAHNLTWGMDV